MLIPNLRNPYFKITHYTERNWTKCYRFFRPHWEWTPIRYTQRRVWLGHKTYKWQRHTIFDEHSYYVPISSPKYRKGGRRPTNCAITPLLCMAPWLSHNDIYVWFLWPHHGATIHSLVQCGQIACNSNQIRNTITTDITVDVSTS